MALTHAKMQELLAGNKASKKGNALVRDSEGNLTRESVKSSEYGKFEGKCAPMTRTRKGSKRGKGGTRDYNDGSAVYDNRVVAYLA